MGSDSESKPDGPSNGKADERVSIPLPFEDAMRGLLQVKPDEDDDAPDGKPNQPRAAPKNAARSEKRK